MVPVELTVRRAAIAATVAVAALAVTLVATRHDTPAAALRTLDAPAAAEPLPTPTPSATTEAPPSPTATPARVPAPVPTLSPTVVVPTLPVPTAVPTVAPDPVVEVTPSNDAVLAGTKMTITVRWRAKGRPRIHVDPGDGSLGMDLGGCYGTPYDVRKAGDYRVATLEWSYRRAGTYTVRAHTVFSDCDTGVPLAFSEPRHVVVTGSTDATNGPWEPRASLRFPTAEQMGANPGTSPYVVWIGVSTGDPDGWLRGWVVDFHDGLPPETGELPLADCVLDGRPDASFQAGGTAGVGGSHTVPGPGTYHVTLTAYSESCTGDEVQTTTVYATVVVTG